MLRLRRSRGHIKHPGDLLAGTLINWQDSCSSLTNISNFYIEASADNSLFVEAWDKTCLNLFGKRVGKNWFWPLRISTL